jgi:hypothetical protein
MDGAGPGACGFEVAGEVIPGRPARGGAGDGGIHGGTVSGRRANMIFDAAVGAMTR